MKTIVVVGEDSLCCALGERLVHAYLPGWTLPVPPVTTHGQSKLERAMSRYESQARMQPVLCIADTDGQCALELVARWRPGRRSPRLLLRFAVREAESWLLGDREELAKALCVSPARLPVAPDTLPDPKQKILAAARKSSRRDIREGIVSSRNSAWQGNAYNELLCPFVRQHWRPEVAASISPSLARTRARLLELDALADR